MGFCGLDAKVGLSKFMGASPSGMAADFGSAYVGSIPSAPIVMSDVIIQPDKQNKVVKLIFPIGGKDGVIVAIDTMEDANALAVEIMKAAIAVFTFHPPTVTETEDLVTIDQIQRGDA